MDKDYMKYQDCIVRKLFRRHFKCEFTEICDDTTEIIEPCGCIAYHTYDDTPGFRLNDWDVDCSNCFLSNCNNTCKGE